MPRIAPCLVVLLCFALNLSAQNAQTQQGMTKDPQAVNIINQALAATGGAQAVTAVKDYTATGTISYLQDVDTAIQGTVTLQGRGSAQFRMDANLPRGVLSSVVNQGQTSANGTSPLRVATNPIPSSDAFPVHADIFPGGLGFPGMELNAALNNPLFALTYKGLVQMNGNSVHDIQVQRVIPGNAAKFKPPRNL